MPTTPETDDAPGCADLYDAVEAHVRRSREHYARGEDEAAVLALCDAINTAQRIEWTMYPSPPIRP